MNAGSAHQQQQRREHAEEEEMTAYSPNGPAEDWEFKILRSVYGEFRKPQRMAEILDQESKAGWLLVEKFDNRRIRLKRRVEARKDDRTLDFDPYQSYVGKSDGTAAAVIVGVTIAVGLAVLILIQVLA